MQAMLKELKAIPGLAGSMLCDREGRVLAEDFPADCGGAALLDAAKTLARGCRELRSVAGDVALLELHHARRRLLARPAGDGLILLLCEKDAKHRQLLAAAAQVIDRHGAAAAAPTPPARRGAAPAEPPPLTDDPFLVAQAGQGASGQSSAPIAFDPPARASTPAPAAPWAPAAPSSGAGRAGSPWMSPKVIVPAAAAALVALGAIVWSALRPSDEPSPARPSAAAAAVGGAKVILRIGGAKSFAAELAPALAEAYLTSLRLEDVRIEKNATGVSRVTGKEGDQLLAVTVEGMPTPQGFDDLASGKLDVAMAGRRILPAWQQKLTSFGTMTAPGYEHVVALSGIAAIVHPSNALPQLNRRQLADVFSGAITDWSQVGGKAGPIRVHAGDEQMGLTDLFKTLVLGKAAYAANAERLPTLKGINEAVALDPQGIGYVTLPFVRGTRALPIAEGDEPALIPTAFTLASEDYFLTHRVYFYTVPRVENPHLLNFVQFALGAEGQAVVKKSGLVELSVQTIQLELPAWAPAGYRRLVEGSRRLTSTFRFEVDSADFDTRALVDLERVTAHLVENRLTGASVKVLGFTDSQGKREHNMELSRSRAELVAKAFAQRGITGVSVSGFGPAMPVASNETADGRQRNRRVEVWIERR